MSSRDHPPTITVIPGRKPGFLTTNFNLVLQRQGVSEVLAAAVGLGQVIVQPTPGTTTGTWTATVRAELATESVQTPDFDTAYRTAAELAARLVGFSLVPALFVAASAFGHDPPDVRSGDKIVSPLRYEPETDTVRIVATNVCVAAFHHGAFIGAHVFQSDVAGGDIWPDVARALDSGFDEDVLARGDVFAA